MRISLLLSLSLLIPLLTGCETAFGGSPQSSLNKLSAKESAKVDSMEESGQLTAEEAQQQRNAINQRTQHMEDSVNETVSVSGSPAGE